MEEKLFKFIKNLLGVSMQKDYAKFLSDIARWKLYYQGYDPQFHVYKSGAAKKKFRMKSMELGKTVAETWAGLVVNENTDFQFTDARVRQLLIGDEKSSQRSGIFGANNIWGNLTKWGEKIFGYAGSGVFVAYVDNAYIYDLRSQPEIEMNAAPILELRGGDIKVKFVPADQIIPISYDDDKLHELIVCGKKNWRGKDYYILEVYTQEIVFTQGSEKTVYVVKNIVAEKQAGSGDFTANEAVLAEMGLISEVRWDTKVFSDLWNTAFTNNKVEGLPFALPAIAGAIDPMQDADLAFNNKSRDVILGAKRVFVQQDYITTRLEEQADGKKKAVATEGDDLFTAVPTTDEMDKQLVKEYNPSLRVEENVRAIQSALDLVSFKSGLGKGYFKLDDTKQAVTAYEVKTSNSDLTFSIQRMRTIFLDIFPKFCQSIVALHNELNKDTIPTNSNIEIKFDDGALKDPEADRAKDLLDVQNNIMAKWEFRMKWYNETEKEAKAAIDGITVPTLGEFFNQTV